MFEGHDRAVHDILAERRLVEPSVLESARDESRRNGRSLAGTLIEAGWIGKPALLRAVADALGYDYLEQLPATVPADVIALVVAPLARIRRVAPLAADETSVTLVAVDPFSPDLCPDMVFALDLDVRLCVADPEQVREMIRRYYSEEAERAGESGAPGNGPGEAGGATLEQLAGQTPVIRYVKDVLGQAIRDRASDLHFEPFEQDFRIRYRIDGTLTDLAAPPKAMALPVISRLKVMAGLNIAERRLPQDGRIRMTAADRTVDFRVSTLPTQFGESVVLRVLDQSAVGLELAQLGLPATMRAGVEEIIRQPNGIFVVTGPTGSGKTTTLYGCLKKLNQAEAKLLTVEDPVEYEIEGVVQVPVNPAAGLTFARALRAFLRQDPDIVMIGEVRDQETAQIAVQASLTGHLVLTTLHTNDAASAVTRLMDIGAPPYLLAATLQGVLAQRLLRRICPHCRIEARPPGSLRRQLDVPAGLRCWRGAGCEQCGHTGFRGRVGVFEFLRVSTSLREYIAGAVPLNMLRRQALAEGLVPLRDAALAAVASGETTLEEAGKYV